MGRRPRRLARLTRALLGGSPSAYRDSFTALLTAVLASLVAGVTLAVTTGTLEELPGLLLLVPAALAVKGNVFGALGSRLGTSIHAGVFRPSLRLDTVVGQNTAAAMVLSLTMAVILAVLAKGVAIVFDVSPTMSIADFVVVSTISGLLASVVVLAITLGIAAGSVRRGWDLDNVAAPLVTAAGDVVTLPALIWAAELAGIKGVTPAIAIVVTILALAGSVWSLRVRHSELRTIMVESLPILVLAAALDLIAGIAIEKRLDDFVAYPVMLVLLPGFLSTAGNLGGVLSSRLSSKLHLGLIRPAPLPTREAGGDLAMIFVLSIPVFAVAGVVAQAGGNMIGAQSPGLGEVVAVAMLGGVIATVCAVMVSYYSTIAAVRFGLDPDTFGIPMVSSSLDFVGVFAMILALVAVGVA